MKNASRGSYRRGVLSALEEHQSASRSVCADAAKHRPISKAMGRCEGLKRKRKDALAGDWRGANEEANLPLAGNDDGFGLGSGSSQLHDDNDGRSSGNGHYRVHDDAELAVIRVGLVRVKVRRLSDGQHRQQDQTDDRHGRQKAGHKAALGSALAAENCLKSRQSMKPSGSILQKARFNLDALGLERLQLSYDFGATSGPTPTGRERLN